MIKQTPYRVFLATLRDKDRPGPMVPTGVLAAKHANYVGNYLINPKSNWGNLQNGPPNCWEGLMYDNP